MISEIKLKPSTHMAPLCIKHFLQIAKEYHLATLPSAIPPQPCLSDPQPSRSGKGVAGRRPAPQRIQPRRAVKDKHPHAHVAMQPRKRSLSGPDPNLPTRKRKLQEEDNLSGTDAKNVKNMDWEEVRLGLLQSIYGEVRLCREREECIYGPKPWLCGLCANQIVQECSEFGAVGWNYHQGIAPVATMEPVGQKLYLVDWKDLTVRKEEVYQFGGVTYMVDACRNPMVLIL